MLNRKVIITQAGGRSISFKYMTPEDFVVAAGNARQDKYGDRTESLRNAAGALKYRLESGDKSNQAPLPVTDLAVHKVLIEGLYNAVLTAERAAKEAAALLGSYSDWRGDNKRVGRAILDAYFNGTTDERRIRQIAAVFRETANGLSGNLVIADLAGREQGAEGNVRLKGDADARMQREWIPIHEKLQERKEEIKNKRNVLKIPRVDEEKNLLMARYLATEAKGSIHIQFSYCFKYSLLEMTRIIVHEATHKFAATADFAYADHGHDLRTYLDLDHAILNADSYAYAALSALERKVATPETLKSARITLHQFATDAMLHL